MPNTIKYSTLGDTQSLRHYEHYIGVGDVPKGPTSETGHYNGINPPTGGYVIYVNKSSDGPSIYIASNDAELITLTNKISGVNYTSVLECKYYYITQNDKMVVNRTYESIITSDLALMLDAGYLPSFPTYNTIWKDLSYKLTNGFLVNNPTFSMLEGGGSIVLDGINDYIDLQKGTISNQTYGNYSFSLWFTPNSNITPSNPNNYMFFEAQNTLLNGVDNYLYILGSTSGRFGWQMFNPLSTVYSTTSNWDAGTWYNITCTYNITTSQQSIYVNGIKESSVTIANCYINTNSYFSLGAYSSPSKIWFTPAKLGNFMIYLKTLSDSEVLQNYNALKTRFNTSLLVLNLDASNVTSYPTSGTTWQDLSGYEHNGTLVNGPTFNSGNGGSIVLDGVDDYITIPKTGILSGKNAFTISLWTYPTSLVGIRPLFVNYYFSNLEVLTRFNGTNLQFYTYSSTNVQVGGTTQTYSTLNQWVNIVATYNGSIMMTYVNGVQSPTTYTQTGILNTSTLPYLIGKYISPTEYVYEGRFSQTLIYLKALTAQEILQNYNALKTRYGL